jgi:hypothetical protein
MIRRILLSTCSSALLLLASVSAQADQPFHSDQPLLQAQWAPGPGYGREWDGRREHCFRMRERFHGVRARMQNAPPWERERLGARLYELRERLRRECWGHWRDED